MILSFSRDSFEGAIKARTKIHTIRRDEHNRWKTGMSIQFWRGNPRNVKSNPYQFGTGVVNRIGFIEIYPTKNLIRLSYAGVNYLPVSDIRALNQLARNDGFRDWEEMKEWFTEDFTGKLIIWKDFEAIN